jgi:hypothetical protein
MNELLPTLNEVFFDWLKPHQWAAVWDGVNAAAQMAILQRLALVVLERILQATDRVVVARLLGLMAMVCPTWVSKGVAEAIV